MARFASLAVVLLLFACADAASARQDGTLDEYGLSVTLVRGWHGLAAPGQLQVADFPLARAVLASPERARVPRGHVHLIVWDYGPAVPYLSFPPARAPLVLGRRDITAAPFEGFPAGDVYAVRSLLLGGEQLEVLADLGPKPLAPNSLQKANRILVTLRVQPPRVLLPRHGRLTSDGVGLRLLPGWSGRIEIPANQAAAQLVLRAQHGDVHVVLLQMAGAQGSHADLPIVLTTKNVLHRQPIAIARRVFSTAGRSFDLSVTVPSARDLVRANRLLATLTAKPRPWTFRSCDLSLRLPGTWRAAVNRRSGCYPVVTLRAPGIRVVLTELRPAERAGGRILRTSGRRFHVEIRPASATREADAVLATLSATARR
ncbi:MAG: hypothetical protein ACJ76I_09620 [Gaiellaceae bacterium]